MNIEGQNQTSQKAYETNEEANIMNLPSLLLNLNLFRDKIFDSIKNDNTITNIDELVEAFSKNKEALKTLLCKTIKSKGLIINKKKEKNIKNINISEHLTTSENSANENFSQNDVVTKHQTDQSNSYANECGICLGAYGEIFWL